MKYCGVSTPFIGIRVYTRSALGLPGSETSLEELISRVMGGCVAKIADDFLTLGNLRTTTTTLSTTTGSELECTAQARPAKFGRRGVVDNAKQGRITSSCNPQASAGINPLF